MSEKLQCIMPWKALFMDELDGKIMALPCCLSWIQADFGRIGTSKFIDLWNSEGAQRIRYLIAKGRQAEICDRFCTYLQSGNHSESAIRLINGPQMFMENQLLNNEEIKKRQTILNSMPMFLKVLPTLRCNNRCTMCFQNHYDDIDVGPSFWQEIEAVLPYLYEITFQGGEVTLDRGFREFLRSKALRFNSHVNISLISNGTVLDDDLYESLKENRLNYIIISINAATRKTYEKITKNDFFERVINNVERLYSLSELHPIKHFEIIVSFVVMRSNYRELPQFMRLAKQLGAKVQLLNVIGNREGEDVFIRKDLHNDLLYILTEASKVAQESALHQIERIRKIITHEMDIS
jgi:molybdenum cofactor biosynthesis enzyme MoaA